jgi:hypothetical protein
MSKCKQYGDTEARWWFGEYGRREYMLAQGFPVHQVSYAKLRNWKACESKRLHM